MSRIMVNLIVLRTEARSNIELVMLKSIDSMLAENRTKEIVQRKLTILRQIIKSRKAFNKRLDNLLAPARRLA